MNKVIHYVGLDVHKETIAVSIAPAGSTLDAVDKVIKKLSASSVQSSGTRDQMT